MQLDWPVPSDFPALTANEVHVWAVPLDELTASPAELAAALSADERARSASFARHEPRQTFLASRATLRLILGSYLKISPRDVSITIGVNGKPRLVNGGLLFNLAHSRDLTLIAVTHSGEIGVDIEFLRPVDNSLVIAARNFHAAERDAIFAVNDADLPATFLRCWTRKEAVVKALGVGIGYALDAFDALSTPRPEQAIDLPGDRPQLLTRCFLHDLHPSSVYVAAVATTKPTPPPQTFTYCLG